MADDLVVVGRIIKPHGIRGEVVVDVMSDVPGRLDAGVEVRVGGAVRTVASSRAHQGRLLVRFEGVDDRTAAEGLRGREITAAPVDLGDADTYYAHELVGMPVRDQDGAPLGEVTALIDLPSVAGYDLLEVTRPGGGTWLLPAVDDYVVVEIDEDGRELLVLVDPPEGLLDLDQAVEAGAEGIEATGEAQGGD